MKTSVQSAADLFRSLDHRHHNARLLGTIKTIDDSASRVASRSPVLPHAAVYSEFTAATCGRAPNLDAFVAVCHRGSDSRPFFRGGPIQPAGNNLSDLLHQKPDRQRDEGDRNRQLNPRADAHHHTTNPIRLAPHNNSASRITISIPSTALTDKHSVLVQFMFVVSVGVASCCSELNPNRSRLPQLPKHNRANLEQLFGHSGRTSRRSFSRSACAAASVTPNTSSTVNAASRSKRGWRSSKRSELSR